MKASPAPPEIAPATPNSNGGGGGAGSSVAGDVGGSGDNNLNSGGNSGGGDKKVVGEDSFKISDREVICSVFIRRQCGEEGMIKEGRFIIGGDKNGFITIFENPVLCEEDEYDDSLDFSDEENDGDDDEEEDDEDGKDEKEEGVTN